MTQKVIKIGTSVGVTIPKQALKDLRLRAGEHVEVTWNAQKATFAVHKPQHGSVDKELMEWTERFVEAYKPALRALMLDEQRRSTRAARSLLKSKNSVKTGQGKKLRSLKDLR